MRVGFIFIGKPATTMIGGDLGRVYTSVRWFLE
jgi:hypothetical protein